MKPAVRILLLALALPTAAQVGQATDLARLCAEIVETVRTDFWDPEAAETWAIRNAGYAEGLENTTEDRAVFVRETRERLAELATSHTAYYTQDDRAYWDLRAIFGRTLRPPGDSNGKEGSPVEIDSAGLSARELSHGSGESWFVERVFAGGPAAAAGVLRGDRLVAVDGEPFHPLASFRGRSGQEVELELERRPDERLRVRLTPERLSPLDEWLRDHREDTRIVDIRGRRVAYAPVWTCVGGVMEALGEALQGDLAEAEALVVDLRAGWGGCNPEMLHLFNPVAPSLTRITREGERFDWSPSWKKPLVVLIDGGSRSGKEVVARAVQRHGLGVLVGERTAGAAVGGRPYLLSDGSLLYLAVQGFLAEGERIEGIGVAPEVPVEAPLPFAAGADPQLDRALDIASDLALKRAPSRPANPAPTP